MILPSLLLLAACTGSKDVVLADDTAAPTDTDTDSGTSTTGTTDPTGTTPTNDPAVDDDGDGLSEDQGDCDDTLPNWTETCPWTAVNVGYANACGIRSDGVLTCWGSDYYAVDVGPEGRFTAVSVGFDHACAVRDSGEVACWGTDVGYGTLDTPDGQFVAVEAGGYSNCGVLVDGDVACWGYGWDGTEVVYAAETYTQVAMSSYTLCALSDASTVRCQSPYGGTIGDFSGDDYVDMDLGYVAFAVGADGRIEMEGEDTYEYGLDEIPDGTWTEVSTYGATACAGDADGHLTCWGDDTYGQGSPPAGEFGFHDVSVGTAAGCALTDDGNVLCWGWYGYGGEGPE